MSLLNTTLWGNILPGGPLNDSAAGNLDPTQVIDELLPTLHAANRNELTFWTEADLLEWLDEALKRLARVACVFVGNATTTLTVQGQAFYSLPERHIATLHLSYLTTAMRSAAMIDLEMRDPAFQTTQGTPDHWYQDLQGGTVFGLAPVPDTNDVPLPIVYEGWPDPNQTLIGAPAPLKGYLAMKVLEGAYGREGEMESPDIAAHCKMRAEMYEQLFVSYYGPGY
jgi:hypothetical protein